MIDSRSQALDFNREVQARMLESFAARSTLRIAVVGGGGTGVELAAELIHLTEVGGHYGAEALSGQVAVMLIESGGRLLRAFPDRDAAAARERLERLGITFLTGARVAAAEPRGFRLAHGSRIDADLKIWAAGVKASDACSSLDGLEVTHDNQIVVNPTLQTTRDPSIFAIGDCSSVRLGDVASRCLPQHRLRMSRRPISSVISPAGSRGRLCRPLPTAISAPSYSLAQFGLFKGGFIRGRVAQLGHILLYRSHKARLHGFWRGGLIWLADTINYLVRPRLRLHN